MTHPFTPTYIAMAQGSEEIRAMRPEDESYVLGDWFIGDHGPELYDRSTVYFGLKPAWLPLLHQLLGMLGEPYQFGKFAFRIGADNDGDGHFDTYLDIQSEYYKLDDWHELALAVVMKVKFGKTWRDGAWVKV